MNIQQPTYVNLSTTFRYLLLRVVMAFCLKHIYSVLFKFIRRPMPPAVGSRHHSRDSA